MKKFASLIFDIGKTTKKALLFDSSFQVLLETTEDFSEIDDGDGFPCENLKGLSIWVTEIVRQYISHPAYIVTAINFSAYGASLVFIDHDEKAIEPFYNYLKPLPEEIAVNFRSQYDQKGAIEKETSSPWLGMLNSGLQLYWMKKTKPQSFKNIKSVLHFPQYFPFLLSGNKFCDITSVGCHTMLWDFEKMNYHRWVNEETFDQLFPKVLQPHTTFDVNLSGKKIKMGIGVHDSSAALLPYMVTQAEPFILLSTGTWNIAFNPFNHSPLTQDELKNDCLCYLSYNGKPIKASRLFLGYEHELQCKALTSYFQVDEKAHNSLKFDLAVYNNLPNGVATEFHPLALTSAGDKKQIDYNVFNNFQQAYYQMVRYLVKWQNASLDLVDPDNAIKRIIIVGGFTKNPIFLEILKRAVKNRKLLLSDHPRGSALGAAWLVNDLCTTSKEQILKVQEV